MPFTRRRLLWAAGLIPLGLAASAIASGAGDMIRSTARTLRPRAAGTSATRCALCGAVGHAMLDPRCPAARRII